MKSRQDAWTEENDLLLAETVLRHVREGSTQLNAFEEVGDRLDRTSAACGFRWNAVVRHDYEKALALAKKQRKQRQRMLGKDHAGKKKLLYDPPVVPVFLEEFSSPLEDEILDMDYDEEVTMVEVQEDNKPTTFTTAITSNQKVEKQVKSSYQSSITIDQVIGYLHSIKTSHMQSDVYRLENDRLKRELADVQRKNRELENKIKHLEQNSSIMQEDYETLMKIMNRARKLAVLDEEDDRSTTKFKMDKNGNLEKVAE